MRATRPHHLVAIGCLGLVAALVGFAGDEAQAAVGCGDKITRDTTLHRDLVNCPNNGVTIGADGITLNLNGHLIAGNGKPSANCNDQTEFCDTGVADDGHDGLTVVHGSVRQFAAGVNVFGPARHIRLLGISASRNKVVGFSFARVVRGVIRNSSARHSLGPDAYAALGIFDSARLRVIDNSFRRIGSDHGVVVFESPNNVIKGNHIRANGGDGLLLQNSRRNRITHNRLSQNGSGITLGPGTRNVIRRNHVIEGRDGIRIEKGRGNLVAHNTVIHPSRVGVRLGITNPVLGGAQNTVRGNLVRHSHRDGFMVLAKDSHSLLEDNVARGARDDGFDIQSPSATLTHNRADRNGDLGIEAVHEVNDGGGNIAHHNGDSRECTNIACH